MNNHEKPRLRDPVPKKRRQTMWFMKVQYVDTMGKTPTFPVVFDITTAERLLIFMCYWTERKDWKNNAALKSI